MDPPKLNFEVKASLQKAILKRDTRIVKKPEKITAGFAGLSKLTSLIMQSSNEKITMVKIISSVLRLLADL